jgi:hypothetical protein
MLDFLGIGAQKAGTSWLHAALVRHPQLRFPAGKEVHFWDVHRANGVAWYQGLFPEQPPGVKSGEITPAYAFLPPAVIAGIRELNPQLRIIYLLRNPIERAWSSALMALGRAEMTLADASDQWFIDHFRSRGSRARGDYEACLRNWRGAFGEDAVLLLRYEQLREQPFALLASACRHIGVEPGFHAREQPAGIGERVNPGPEATLRPSLLPVLRELYRPKIAGLAAYLGWDLSAWLKT